MCGVYCCNVRRLTNDHHERIIILSWSTLALWNAPQYPTLCSLSWANTCESMHLSLRRTLTFVRVFGLCWNDANIHINASAHVHRRSSEANIPWGKLRGALRNTSCTCCNTVQLKSTQLRLRSKQTVSSFCRMTQNPETLQTSLYLQSRPIPRQSEPSEQWPRITRCLLEPTGASCSANPACFH